jgi:hypothetical protein
VLERGYNIQDEIFLHREQRGKIAGVETISPKEDRQWAAAGLEGKIVRRCGIHRAVLWSLLLSSLLRAQCAALRTYLSRF